MRLGPNVRLCNFRSETCGSAPNAPFSAAMPASCAKGKGGNLFTP